MVDIYDIGARVIDENGQISQSDFIIYDNPWQNYVKNAMRLNANELKFRPTLGMSLFSYLKAADSGIQYPKGGIDIYIQDFLKAKGVPIKDYTSSVNGNGEFNVKISVYNSNGENLTENINLGVQNAIQR